MPWLSCCRVATLADVLSLVQKANSGGKDVGVFVQVGRLLVAALHAGALH